MAPLHRVIKKAIVERQENVKRMKQLQKELADLSDDISSTDGFFNGDLDYQNYIFIMKLPLNEFLTHSCTYLSQCLDWLNAKGGEIYSAGSVDAYKYKYTAIKNRLVELSNIQNAKDQMDAAKEYFPKLARDLSFGFAKLCICAGEAESGAIAMKHYAEKLSGFTNETFQAGTTNHG